MALAIETMECGVVESVLAYLALFDLGIGAAVVRYVVRFRETQERDELNRVFSTSLAIFAGLGLVALAITLTLAFGWSRPLGVPEDVSGAARWLLVLLGLNLAVGLPLGVYDSVLYALGRFPLRTAVQLSVLSVRTAAFLWIIQRGGGLVEIGLAITVLGVLQHVVLLSIVHWLLPNLRFSVRFLTRSTFRTICGYSMWAFVAMIAGRISFSTDAIVISAFLTPEYITYFAIAARLVDYGKTAVQSATGVLTPAISTLEVKGDFAAIRGVLITGSRCVVWFILPFQLGFMFFGYTFLSMWMDDQIAVAAFIPLLALSSTLTLATSQFVSARLLYGMGRLGWFARATIAEALANLVLSLLLVHKFGIVGVAIGTAIPNLLFNLCLSSTFVRQLTCVWAAISEGHSCCLSPPHSCLCRRGMVGAAISASRQLGPHCYWPGPLARWHILSRVASLNRTSARGCTNEWHTRAARHRHVLLRRQQQLLRYRHRGHVDVSGHILFREHCSRVPL